MSAPRELLEGEAWLYALATVSADQCSILKTKIEALIERMEVLRDQFNALNSEGRKLMAEHVRLTTLTLETAREAAACTFRRKARARALEARDIRHGGIEAAHQRKGRAA